MDVDLEFLTGGVRYSRPYKALETAMLTTTIGDRGRRSPWTHHAPRQGLFDVLLEVLAHRDVCSRASIFERYDGVVRGCTAIPPGFADAGVLVPIPGAPLGVALGLGGNPRYGMLDPRRAAELAVVEAIANVTAVGATPAGLTDCLNFGDPTVPEQMGAFVAAVDGLALAARALAVPFVSGNVSLYNRSSTGNHVAPSPIVACIGTIADVSRTATISFKHAGSAIMLIGEPQILFWGSVFAEIAGLTPGPPPPVDYEYFAKCSAFLREAFARNLVLAAHDVSDGGILTAIAEMSLASAPHYMDREIGAHFYSLDMTVEAWLSNASWFEEFPGYVCEVEDERRFCDLAREMGVHAHCLGKTIAEPVLLFYDGYDAVGMRQVRTAWQKPLQDFYGAA
jgi:phosphoribosylformylglycinamidine synthase